MVKIGETKKISDLYCWTSSDVFEAKKFIDKECPSAWEKLVEIEATTQDFRDVELAHVIQSKLRKKYADYDPLEVVTLLGELRELMRREIHASKSNLE